MSVFAGFDVGSLVTKCVILNNGNILSSSIVDSRSDPEKAAEKALEIGLSKAHLTKEDIAYTVATGYGRIALPAVDKTVTELTCHGRGAHHLCPEARTVIDIGGQDSKILRLDEQGNMIEFAMNDKCAAGTGRFLEVMAHALEIELDELGEFSLQSNNPVSLSNTCAVFAETEIISLLASKRPKEDIAAGIHTSIAGRVGNMARSFGVHSDLMMVGGVAKNVGVKKALEDFLQVKFALVDTDPQITGALGAALLARNSFEGRSQP
ncbi:MAG: acyl-CoA dehydratase activase [Desulfatiglans sp.]|jgi:predicted CoA-substrate-specific enzyme activase|nr:acyl-CoA dehydratase activase [Thermodesulfobacteriota bacterium]MEE4353941.1 acyl-CoA dehydratase activase [Desulfatiglans sp.]